MGAAPGHAPDLPETDDHAMLYSVDARRGGGAVRQRPTNPGCDHSRRIAVLVPAHNETAAPITPTLEDINVCRTQFYRGLPPLRKKRRLSGGSMVPVSVRIGIPLSCKSW